MDIDIQNFIIKEIEKRVNLPVGAIFAFPSEKIPQGFLPCEGQEISTQQYPELFSILGYTFGGNGKTFCLPDLQGQFIRGLDREGNVDVEETGQLRKIGTSQEDALQGHSHSIPSIKTNDSGYHSHRVYYKGFSVGSNTFTKNDMRVFEVPSGYSGSNPLSDGQGTDSNGYHSHYLPESATGGAINHTFGKTRVCSETRPRNIALIFCIKVN